MNGSSLHSFSRVTSATTLLVGCLVLVGWALDIGALKSVLLGLATMKANTALCFILAGLSLWTQQDRRTTAWKRRLGLASASAVAVIGGLTLSEYLLDLDFGIDLFVFNDREGAPPGRMSQATALSFLTLGLALALLAGETGTRRLWLVQALALVSGLFGFIALLGYVYGVESLYKFGPYSTMALHTVILTVFFSGGILCARPDSGLMATIMQDAIGSLMMRRLVPVAIVVPLVLGWLRLQGQRAGLYSLEFGTAMHAVSGVIIFSVLIWTVGRSLNRTDAERKRAEEALRESERRTRAILENSLDAVIGMDANGVINDWNLQAEGMFGWIRDEAIGRSLSGTIIPPQYREAHARGLRHFLATGEGPVLNRRIEVTALRRDGSEFSVELAISPIRIGDSHGFTAFIADISERKQAETALKSLAESLEQQVQVRTTELNQRATEAEQLNRGMANLMEDVNATYKRAESTARQLEAANKELEAFSYSVSHDLRAPLRHIDGYADMLQKHAAANLDTKGKRYLMTISESAKQMGCLIDDLLVFSRMGRAEMYRTVVNLNRLVEEVMHDMRQDLEGRRIVWNIGSLSTVHGDPSMLRQVLVNLIGNAVKYSRLREEAKIEIGSSNGASNETVVFIRDNGVGFDMQYAPKLFGVFQRLHGASDFEGSGIGLANVKRIIQRHGGRTWAEGKVGEGATFYFSLPAWQTGEAGRTHGGGLTLLKNDGRAQTGKCISSVSALHTEEGGRHASEGS